MTGNRTTELCKLLEDYGAEFKTHDIIAGKAVTWSGSVCDWVALPDEMGLAVAVYKDYLTPEQVIAATLGSGKLTAEQVREVIERRVEFYEGGDYDEQAIADDLNSMLGNRTCRLEETASYSNANEIIHLLECSECGRTCEHVNGSYPRCPHCGAKAVK